MKTNLAGILSKTGGMLNQNNILWGVGGSVLLWCYQLVDEYHNIGIIVSEKDIGKTDMLLSGIGTRLPETKNDFYDPVFFQKYRVDGFSVDVTSGLAIRTNDTIYRYAFDERSLPHSVRMGGEQIPFTTLEEWYVLYSLFPQGENRARLIETFFADTGVIYPQVMKRMLTDSLPDHITRKCNSLLNIQAA